MTESQKKRKSQFGKEMRSCKQERRVCRTRASVRHSVKQNKGVGAQGRRTVKLRTEKRERVEGREGLKVGSFKVRSQGGGGNQTLCRIKRTKKKGFTRRVFPKAGGKRRKIEKKCSPCGPRKRVEKVARGRTDRQPKRGTAFLGGKTTLNKNWPPSGTVKVKSAVWETRNSCCNVARGE